MREIKFRMWDSYHKVMDYDPGYDADWERVGLNSTLKNSAATTYMQYTGLKDKNGVDIYEGDIVSYVPWGSVAPVKDIVKWDEEYLGYRLDPPVSGYEIIGNIHQNSEPVDE